MGRECLLCLVLLLSLWKTADSAKITCKHCKDFVVSFNKQLEATANSSYAGGDTSWEEENLGSYSESEVRLVEILDTTCGKTDYDCHRLLEETEEDIEKWWLKLKKEKTELQPWLCFIHLAVCCPADTFGPDCQPCPGAPNNICGGRGKCEGAEEKEGKGTCTCDRGYTGDMCQQCDGRFYQEKTDDDDDEEEEEGAGKLECKECDRSCDKSCDGPDSGDCDACADGYKENDDGACEDVDECKIDGDTRCKEGMYCSNTPGSFKCHDCDKACRKICNGPGPIKCAECADGYSRNEHGVCKDDDECEAGSAKCNVGTYCENTPGKFTCKACHVACMSGCHSAGTKGCVACKDGYVMSTEEGCEDINECEGDTEPCDVETEVCSNLLGTFTCKCKSGLVKGQEGRCVTAEERDAQRETQKTKNAKKKKKKKKKKKEAEPVNKAEVQAEGERRSLGDLEPEESGRSLRDSEESGRSLRDSEESGRSQEDSKESGRGQADLGDSGRSQGDSRDSEESGRSQGDLEEVGVARDVDNESLSSSEAGKGPVGDSVTEQGAEKEPGVTEEAGKEPGVTEGVEKEPEGVGLSPADVQSGDHEEL